MTTTTLRPRTTPVGRLQLVIFLLVAATALVHLYLGVITTVMVATQPAEVTALGGATALSIMAALFYCSFLGYVVLALGMYAPALHRFSRLARWGLIVWTAGNIVAYVALAHASVDAFGIADKVCEVALIALLLIENRRGAGLTRDGGTPPAAGVVVRRRRSRRRPCA